MDEHRRRVADEAERPRHPDEPCRLQLRPPSGALRRIVRGPQGRGRWPCSGPTEPANRRRCASWPGSVPPREGPSASTARASPSSPPSGAPRWVSISSRAERGVRRHDRRRATSNSARSSTGGTGPTGIDGSHGSTSCSPCWPVGRTTSASFALGRAAADARAGHHAAARSEGPHDRRALPRSRPACRRGA